MSRRKERLGESPYTPKETVAYAMPTNSESVKQRYYKIILRSSKKELKMTEGVLRKVGLWVKLLELVSKEQRLFASHAQTMVGGTGYFDQDLPDVRGIAYGQDMIGRDFVLFDAKTEEGEHKFVVFQRYVDGMRVFAVSTLVGSGYLHGAMRSTDLEKLIKLYQTGAADWVVEADEYGPSELHHYELRRPVEVTVPT